MFKVPYVNICPSSIKFNVQVRKYWRARYAENRNKEAIFYLSFMIPGKKYNSTIQFGHGEKSFLEDSALKSDHFKDDEDLINATQPGRPQNKEFEKI